MKMFKTMAAGLMLITAIPLVAADSMQPLKSGATHEQHHKKRLKNTRAQKPKDQAKAMYMCEHCGTKSDKPGKCPMCGMDMKKM